MRQEHPSQQGYEPPTFKDTKPDFTTNRGEPAIHTIRPTQNTSAPRSGTSFEPKQPALEDRNSNCAQTPTKSITASQSMLSTKKRSSVIKAYEPAVVSIVQFDLSKAVPDLCWCVSLATMDGTEESVVVTQFNEYLMSRSDPEMSNPRHNTTIMKMPGSGMERGIPGNVIEHVEEGAAGPLRWFRDGWAQLWHSCSPTIHAK